MFFIIDKSIMQYKYALHQQNVSDVTVLYLLSQDQYQQSDLVKSCSVYQQHGEWEASRMDVMRAENPKQLFGCNLTSHS